MGEGGCMSARPNTPAAARRDL